MSKEKKELNYWSEQLKEIKNSEKFIWDHYDETLYKKNIYIEVLDEECVRKLNDICKNNNLLIYTVLISTLGITLSKYMNKNDILIGIPCYINQDNSKHMYINKLLPIISHIDCEKTYLDYMNLIKAKVLGNYKNQAYLNAKMLLQNNLPNDVMELTPISICMKGLHDEKDIEYICESGKNELSFLIEPTGGKSIDIQIVYNSNKITESTIKSLYESYITALNEILNNFNKKIKDIKILSKKNINKILYSFNDTRVDYPKDKTIQELFEEQVEKTPNNIAVIFENKKLSYKELNERSNSVARILRDKGVKANSIVGIMVERSLEMIIGILGILKSGGAYLPIDPKYPKKRIEFMLEDSRSNLLLSKNTLVEDINFDGEVVNLFNKDLFSKDTSNLSQVNKANDLVYVIYTSGTTGIPKGVMVEHRNLITYLCAFLSEFKLNEKDVVLQQATYCFDGFIEEIYPIILVGGKFVMCNKYDVIDMVNLEYIVEKHKISMITCSPLLLNELNKCKRMNSVHTFISGGEVLRKSYFNNLIEYAKVYNTYGPTEATVCSCYYRCEDLSIDNIPIGKPIKNYRVYILDENMNLKPVGGYGELYISGNGVARGYINRTELTDEKFIDNPFESGEKLYKTGDLARWLPDGNIEFLGRIDDQVKIRGFRIELGEIENKLLQHKSIKEVVVLVKENKDNEKYICAYVVSKKNLKDLDLKSYLKETLPEYMVPAYFVELEKIPLATNGKLDRRALPEPNLYGTLTDYESPRNDLEKCLVQIWSEVLGVRKIGINDNFFDIGGHSLKATILMSKIHKELNKEVPLKELFKSPTIKELSHYIENIKEDIYSNIEKVKEKEFYEASSAQKRMYMIQQFDKNSTAYNMPVVFELEGKVDKNKIEETLKKLTERHEALKTYFETCNGEVVQKLQNNYEFKLTFREESDNIENIINNFIRPFDLGKIPLFRAEFVKNEKRNYLLLDMHHIISDGTSSNILVKEFVSLYNGKSLEPLKLQYKDFAAWQNKFLKSEGIKKQEKYWINRFNDEIPVLNMPTDYERPPIQSFEGNVINFEIDKETTNGLRKLVRETGTTMYMVLLSVTNILLSKYSGQEDIVIGSPIAGRKHENLQNIIGMFVNTLAIRNFPLRNKVYEEFLGEVKENCLSAYENQEYQFEELVDKLNLQGSTNRNPLFDVMLVLQNMKHYDMKLNDCHLKQYSYDNKTSKFDLFFAAMELEETISIEVQYCSKIFNHSTIEKMIERFGKILMYILNNRQVKISEIDVLLDEERKKILFDFNNTEMIYDTSKTIQELFEEQVEKTPNNVALVFRNKKMTYKEVNESSNNLANYLFHKCNVRNNTKVGILMERSEHMIVAILAILKVRGAYVPIDSKYPLKRSKAIIDDCGINTIISTKNQISIIDKLQWDCSEFKSYVCIDCYDLDEVNNNTSNNLMNDELWDYVAESSSNEIGGGGWKSSYTGEEFSEEEMQEYSKNTLLKLKPYLNKDINVLEIGCASGLTMFEVAPYVNEYYGTDMSNAMISKNKKRVDENDIKNIKLECLQAHEISQIRDKEFDVIIINSVIQYFPGYDYLRSVIKKAINLLSNNGIIYIGDIMDLELKDKLIESLTNYKKRNKSNKNKTKIEFDSELFVPRAYFEDLAVDLKEIDRIKFSKKNHTIENELTRFRYDCILEINKSQIKECIRKKYKHQHTLKDLEKFKNNNYLGNSKSSDVAYIIYTSGSTGEPKGVEIEQKAVINLINGIKTSIDFKNKNAILSITSITFDIFVLETLLPLTIGLKIVIADENEQLDPKILNKLINNWNIDIIQVTPSRMQMLLNGYCDIKSLKAILIGGEPLKEALLKDIVKNTNASIYNMYGPTETTVYSSMYLVDKSLKHKSIPIGKPINNTKIYILNDNKLVPIGVTGELYISGDGVGRGYVNRPELTAEKFVYNPFESGSKMYKTGDLARWLPDGNIELLGRIDNQVKIRGFRIELGEIENRLLQHESVKEAAILVKEDNQNEKYICAYIISEKNIKELDLKSYLKEILPKYMIPTYFVQLERMPLTISGKLEKKALPEPSLDIALNKYEAPRNRIEEVLINIWVEILGVSKIGIDDNFFALGGHSLKAVLLANKIQNDLGIGILLNEIVRNPTIKGISELILSKKNLYNYDLKLINNILIKNFGYEIKLVRYITKYNEIIVLFYNENSKKVINFIKSKFSSKLIPNYICNYEDGLNEKEYVVEISYSEIAKKLKLKKVSEYELEDIINDSKDNYNKIKNEIFKQNIIYKYKIGVIMNKRCENAYSGEKRSIISSLIEINNGIDETKINRIVFKIINSQPVFRTIIVKEDEYLFGEYDTISKINNSIVDISEYDFHSKRKIIECVTESINNIVINQYLNNLLFGFTIFKIDLNNYLMILNMDHQISDMATTRIIKNYFYSSNYEIANIPSYRNYINEIWLMNTEKKFIEFKNSKIYNDYKNSVYQFNKNCYQYGYGQKIIFSNPVIVSCENKFNEKGWITEEKSHMIIGLFITIKILNQIFDLKNIPIRIYYNNRMVKNKNYYYTIGDFTDYTPCTFNGEDNTVENFYKSYIKIRNEISEKGIDMKSIGNYDENYLNFMFKHAPFTFNYLGEVSELESQQFIENIKNVKLGMAYPILAYSVGTSKINFIIYNGIKEEDLEKLKRFFELFEIVYNFTYIV